MRSTTAAQGLVRRGSKRLKTTLLSSPSSSSSQPTSSEEEDDFSDDEPDSDDSISARKPRPLAASRLRVMHRRRRLDCNNSYTRHVALSPKSGNRQVAQAFLNPAKNTKRSTCILDTLQTTAIRPVNISPRKRAFQVLNETDSNTAVLTGPGPLRRSQSLRARVKTAMRDLLPARGRKRKRQTFNSTEDDVMEDGDNTGAQALKPIRQLPQRTRSQVRIADCVRGVRTMEVSDRARVTVLEDSDSDSDSRHSESDSDVLGDPDDEYYLHHAIPSQLQKLRKDKLTDLWTLLIEDYPDSPHALQHRDTDTTLLSKQALIDGILAARTEDDSDSSDQGLVDRSTCFDATNTGSGLTRSTSLPSMTFSNRRIHTRSNSLYGSSDTSRLRSGKLRGSSTDLSASLNYHSGPYRKKSSFGADEHGALGSSKADSVIEEVDEEQDISMREATPIAKRTRGSHVPVHTKENDADAEEGFFGTRTLRNGKVVVVGLAGTQEGDDDEEAPFDASVTMEDVPEDVSDSASSSQASDSEEEDDDNEDDEERSDDYGLSDATQSTLLRYKRQELVELCKARHLSYTGRKSELVIALLAWREARLESSQDEADSSFRPSDEDGASSVVSESEASDHDQDDTDSGDDTAQEAPHTTKPGRRETKTRALARVDKASRTRSGRLPLLDNTQRHIAGPDSRPPEAGGVDTAEEEENGVALDLESLNLQDKVIHPDQLVRGEKIGSGGFKDVYRGTWRKVKVAIADIRDHLSENEIKELGLLRDLRHENIVKLIGVVTYDVATSDVPCSLVTELCMNGDLFDYIRMDAPVPTFDKILKIMIDIAKGLEYLHGRTPKIIHRDMKSSNVLITARGVAKITDFGLARVKNSTKSVIRSLVGTVNWQAPELWVAHPRYNEKVDCYAVGMVYWECLQWHQPVKKYPFEGLNEHAIYQEVGQKHLRPSTASMGRQWGSDILDLVNELWAQSPADRPTMSEALGRLQAMLVSWRASHRQRK